MAGLPTRPSVRFTVATSPSGVSRPYWAAITSCPSACSGGITLLKHEPSAQRPWQNTMLGFSFADMVHLSEKVVRERCVRGRLASAASNHHSSDDGSPFPSFEGPLIASDDGRTNHRLGRLRPASATAYGHHILVHLLPCRERVMLSA